jgi:SP family general alpha glucoside:H+ symporter-like MFS transporter
MASSTVIRDVPPVDTGTVTMDEKDQEAMAHTKAHDQMIHNAKSAAEKEHKMTLMQGVRLYPKAIAWSVLISTCIVMEGYDVCLINNFCE